MVLPDVPAAVFEGEAELAAIIGRRADNVGEADAMDHIFGWTCFIDGSARALPPPGNTFFQVKSRKTFAPIGPWIVTKDEVADPQSLRVRLWNNGELMQDFNTDDMAHAIPRCIAWLSSIHPLAPGDIVATGTNHRGLHPFQDGDRVELEIESVGRLAIDVRDDLKRGWDRMTRLEHAEKGLEGPHRSRASTPEAPLSVTSAHAVRGGTRTRRENAPEAYCARSDGDLAGASAPTTLAIIAVLQK